MLFFTFVKPREFTFKLPNPPAPGVLYMLYSKYNLFTNVEKFLASSLVLKVISVPSVLRLKLYVPIVAFTVALLVYS
mgnify:CR=1 FL=1